MKILDGWINPPNAVASSLFYRSHSAFRVASGQVLAGQLTESYAVMRLCMEFAGYGLLMFSQPRLIVRENMSLTPNRSSATPM